MSDVVTHAGKLRDEITRLSVENARLQEKIRTTHLEYQNQLQHNGFWAFILIVAAFIIGINIQ